MATDLGKTRTAKTAGAKHDAFVQAQLTRAEKRIRMLDIAAALLGFAAILCVAVAAAALCDYAWSLPAWVRQVSFAGFVFAGGVYLVFTLARPLTYRVNPYYAAKAVEQTMPEAKNSVVSWLDLQQEQVAPAIRAAVGQKAAKDLSKTDIEGAFSARRVLWVGAVAVVCAVIFMMCFVRAGSGSFFRVLAPFSFASAEAPTSLTLTKPVNGDDTVTMGQAVTITVHVSGKIPDLPGAGRGPETVRVLVRYQEGDPYKAPLWMRPEGGGDYTAVVQPIDVSEGFHYKVVAGDAETPEYRITVRGRPLLTKVQATYRFRPYTGWEPEHHSAGRTFKMEVLRGTEIALVARTNRPVREATLVLEDADGTKERIAADKDADDAFLFKVKHVVDKKTRYHLEYTTPEGEIYTDPNPPEMVAVVDKPPEPVDLAAPRQTQLPCNGILQVEGAAADDIGVKSLTLRMREVTHKFELQGKPYRSDPELRLQSGGYALKLAYKDFVDLNTVQTPDKKLLALQEGMNLEYWLEASDACDYPKPGVTESKHYFVTLLPPEKDQDKLDQQRQRAQEDQRDHEKKQNEALQKEDQQRLVENAERRNKEQGEDNKPQQGEKKADAKSSGNQGTKDEEIQRQANEWQNKMDQDKERQKQKSNSKDGPQNKASNAKDNGEADKKQQPAEAKQQGQPDPSQKPGESKSGEQQSDPQSAPSQMKEDATHPPQVGEHKPDTSPPNAPPKSEGKDSVPQKPQPPGESKGAPPPQANQKPSESKPDPQPNQQECNKGECKNPGKSTNPDNKNAVPKPDPSPVPNAADGKDAGPNDRGKDPKAQQKPGGSPSSAESKSPPNESGDSVPPAGEKNNPMGGPSDPRNAKPQDVAQAAKDLKSDDPQERQHAAQELKEIADKAQDDKVRKQAQEELEEGGLKPGKSKAPPQKDEKGKPEEVGDKKERQGDPKETLAKAKDGKSDQAPLAEPKDLGKPALKDGLKKPDDPAEKEQLEKRREEFLKKLEQDQKREGKFDEQKFREWVERNRDNLDPPDITTAKGANSTESPEIKDRKAREQRATMMQLREFLKSVDPKVLKDAGISEEQWREFLKNYAEKAVRDEQKKETLPGSQTGRMGSVGGERVNPGAKANPSDPSGPSRAKAPPGYGDAYKKFTEDLNSTGDKK